MRGTAIVYLILPPSPNTKGESVWVTEFLHKGLSCYKAYGTRFLSLLLHSFAQCPDQLFILTIDWSICSTSVTAVFFHPTVCYGTRHHYCSKCLREWIGKDKNNADLPSRVFHLVKFSWLDLCTLVTILVINIS